MKRSIRYPLTPKKILEDLKKVDGKDSGLDADLVRGIPADFENSLGNSGYQNIANGFIIQWDTQTQKTDDNGKATYTFPKSFPNACISVVCVDTDGSTCSDYAVTALNTDSFDVTVNKSDGTLRASEDVSCRFIAIGY
jgi:hypothetical protein